MIVRTIVQNGDFVRVEVISHQFLCFFMIFAPIFSLHWATLSNSSSIQRNLQDFLRRKSIGKHVSGLFPTGRDSAKYLGTHYECFWKKFFRHFFRDFRFDFRLQIFRQKLPPPSALWEAASEAPVTSVFNIFQNGQKIHKVWVLYFPKHPRTPSNSSWSRNYRDFIFGHLIW